MEENTKIENKICDFMFTLGKMTGYLHNAELVELLKDPKFSKINDGDIEELVGHLIEFTGKINR